MDLEKTLSRQEMLSISKPARYIGREWNISLKKKEDVEISVALAFPDLYEIGMSHLGLKTLLYSQFSSWSQAESFCSLAGYGKNDERKTFLFNFRKQNSPFVTLTR